MLEPSSAVVASFPGPWGPVLAAATDRGIVSVALLATPDAFIASLGGSIDTSDGRRTHAPARDALGVLETELRAYFRREHAVFTVPLDLRPRSAWDRLVLDCVGAIAYGSVASYGEVARRIGRFGAARAVGGAVGRNPVAILVPCHRVIAASGAIGGYGGDWYGSRQERVAMKRDLLRLEGTVLPGDPEDRGVGDPGDSTEDESGPFSRWPWPPGSP